MFDTIERCDIACKFIDAIKSVDDSQVSVEKLQFIDSLIIGPLFQDNGKQFS